MLRTTVLHASLTATTAPPSPPFSHPPGKGCTRDHGLTVRTKVISDAALCVMLMTFGLAAGLGQQVASECMRQVVLVAGMSAARIQIDVV